MVRKLSVLSMMLSVVIALLAITSMATLVRNPGLSVQLDDYRVPAAPAVSTAKILPAAPTKRSSPEVRGSLRQASETLPARVTGMRPLIRTSALAAVAVGISLVPGVGASPVASAASRPTSTQSTRPATAAVTGSFGLRVVHQQSDDVSDPRGYYYIVSSVKPGTVVHRQLELDNHTSQAGQLQVYAAAASVSHGQFLGAPGRTQNQLSFWVGVTPSTPVIRSGSVAAITVTITVPANAGPGVQYGVVWAQMQGTGGAGVSLACRVGIRVYFTVLARQ